MADALARRMGRGPSRYEFDEIGNSFVGLVLNETVESGAVVYETPRASKNLHRDLFAHAALYLDGRSFTVLAETTSSVTGERGGTNVDLLMSDGLYWEVKSPTSDGVGKDPTRFVQRRLESAIHNFRDDPRAAGSDVRVVFNARHTPVADGLIRDRIARELPGHPSVAEVLLVRKDGAVEPLAR